MKCLASPVDIETTRTRASNWRDALGATTRNQLPSLLSPTHWGPLRCQPLLCLGQGWIRGRHLDHAACSFFAICSRARWSPRTGPREHATQKLQAKAFRAANLLRAAGAYTGPQGHWRKLTWAHRRTEHPEALKWISGSYLPPRVPNQVPSRVPGACDASHAHGQKPLERAHIEKGVQAKATSAKPPVRACRPTRSLARLHQPLCIRSCLHPVLARAVAAVCGVLGRAPWALWLRVCSSWRLSDCCSSIRSRRCSPFS